MSDEILAALKRLEQKLDELEKRVERLESGEPKTISLSNATVRVGDFYVPLSEVRDPNTIFALGMISVLNVNIDVNRMTGYARAIKAINGLFR